MKNKYAKVFAIVKQINEVGGSVTHKQLVEDFTNGRTTSLNDLTFAEYQEFERSLVKLAPNKKGKNDYKDDPLDSSRKAIIAHFKSIGRKTKDAIDWAEKYGVNGQKKSFNDYNGQELYILIQNAKKVQRSHISGTIKKLNSGIQQGK